MMQWIERNTCSGIESSDEVHPLRWPLLCPAPGSYVNLKLPIHLIFIKFSIHKGMRSSEQGEERRGEEA